VKVNELTVPEFVRNKPNNLLNKYSMFCFHIAEDECAITADNMGKLRKKNYAIKSQAYKFTF
jgi:hypothetical protein